jgi:hypothetical protein
MYNKILSSRSEKFGNAIHPTCGPENPDNWKNKNRYIAEFNYKYNEYGFRCDSFNVKSEFPILFLGCSVTSGVGLPLEETWAYKIYQKIQNKKNISIPFWSLAVGGSSIDLQSLYLLSAIDLIKPKFIFFLLPPIGRRHFYLNNKSILYHPIKGLTIGSEKLTDHDHYIIQKAQELLTDKDYIVFESIKAMMAIDSVCEKYQTKVFYSCWTLNNQEFLDNVNSLKNFTQLSRILDEKDLARDGLHAGPKSHDEFVNYIWPQIEAMI